MTNRITIEGHLGQDPELKFLPDGTALLKFSVGDTIRKKQGTEWVDVNTTWWNCTAWEWRAEAAAEQLAKGDRVIVEGVAQLREYETSSGEKGRSLDVKVDRVGKVAKAARKDGASTQRPATQQSFTAPSSEEPPF